MLTTPPFGGCESLDRLMAYKTIKRQNCVLKRVLLLVPNKYSWVNWSDHERVEAHPGPKIGRT